MSDKVVSITVRLKQPIGSSLNSLFSLASIWGCRVVDSATHRKTVLMTVPASNFQRMFGIAPKKGAFQIPQPLDEFIENMQITGIQ